MYDIAHCNYTLGTVPYTQGTIRFVTRFTLANSLVVLMRISSFISLNVEYFYPFAVAVTTLKPSAPTH